METGDRDESETHREAEDDVSESQSIILNLNDSNIEDHHEPECKTSECLWNYFSVLPKLTIKAILRRNCNTNVY